MHFKLSFTILHFHRFSTPATPFTKQQAVNAANICCCYLARFFPYANINFSCLFFYLPFLFFFSQLDYNHYWNTRTMEIEDEEVENRYIKQ